MGLGELITAIRRHQGLSLEKLAVRARERGYELTRATLSAFETKPLQEAPRRRTMEALAVALDVPFSEVVAAVANSLAPDGDGMKPVTESPHVRAWLTLTEGRSDEEVATMLGVVRSLADALDAGHRRETEQSSGDSAE